MVGLSSRRNYVNMYTQVTSFRGVATESRIYTMTFTKALIGLAAFVAITGAQATSAVTTMPGGSLGTTPPGAFFYGTSGGATDTYSFNLTGTSNLSTSFAALFAPAFVSSITVTKGSFSQTVIPTLDTASFTGLSAGLYSISFATTTAGFGSLIGTVTATPVPEAQTAALAFAGISVLGLLRRRRA